MPSHHMFGVSAVDHQSARFWLRSELPGDVLVGITAGEIPRQTLTIPDNRRPDCDWTMAFTIPDDAPGAGPLIPATSYHYGLRIAGAMVAEGQFETAPVDGALESYAFAFVSCHQPFRSDGSLHARSVQMLSALGSALECRGVKYILFIGDQIYADAAGMNRLLRAGDRAPLAGRSVEDIRALYQDCYRRFWSVPEMSRLCARWAAWSTWDDHDIVDNWGTRPEHLSSSWQRVFQGSRLAYVDYRVSQMMNVPAPLPSSFHYAFKWGCAATYVMDLNSQRYFDGHAGAVYGEDQFDALAAFLRENRDRPVLFIVISVPLVYMPDHVVALGERIPGLTSLFGTRWNASRNRRALDRVFDLLRAQHKAAPDQKLALLSGDVHQACAAELVWPDGQRVMQLVSSPVTNAANGLVEFAARRLAFSMRTVRHGEDRVSLKLLECARPEQRNPFDGLNAGIVYVEARNNGVAVEFELLTTDERAENGIAVAYSSRRSTPTEASRSSSL